ncbi:MAG: hypothetical protein P9M12_02355 [Candidatus Aceula lacicola]|nr:hypothetical protein [Candidatus Aceula lacicola]
MIRFVILGFVSIILQLACLREFTFSIAKNELALILASGLWFIFCSGGSLVGTRRKLFPLSCLPLIFSIVFCFSISVCHLAKLLIGLNYYETTGLNVAILLGVLLIGPLSFLAGYSFGTLCRLYLKHNPYSSKTLSQFFAYEALGIFLGGVAFSFCLSSYSNPFIFVILPILFVPKLYFKKGKKIILSVMLLFLSVAFFFSFTSILKKEFKGADILMNLGSPYGPIILAKKFGTEFLYVNGSLAATSEDKMWNEKFVHISLSAKGNAKNVLLIGPYFVDQINEIMKHHIAQLDCVSINPVLSRLAQEKITRNHRSDINFITNDPRLYIAKTNKKYDCILMNISFPASIELNRYFSVEFFNLVRSHLNKEGVFSFHIPSKRDILSPNILNFNSCIINTLDRAFPHRLLVPSDTMIIMAANTPFASTRLIDNFLKAKIRSDYITAYYLKDFLDPSRQQYFEQMLNTNISINKDYSPTGFLYYLLLQQAKFYPNLSIHVRQTKHIITIAFIVVVLFLGIAGFFKRKKFLIVNAALIGFCSIGMMTTIYVIFQVCSGALFWRMGILIGLFMLGLSLATFYVNFSLEKISTTRRTLAYLYFFWGILILILFLGVKIIEQKTYMTSILYLCAVMAGGLTGAGYPILTNLILKNKANPKNITAWIYSSDLVGSFLGTILFSVLFIPFLGITRSLWMLVFLVLVFGIKNFLMR